MTIRTGSTVKWKWGSSWAEGKVTEVHHDDVSRTTKGEKITRHGSDDDPAYVIEQEDGTVVLKCMLHISPETQKERLLARLDDPTKYWKFNPGDIDERGHWTDYRAAYETMLERTNTEIAPWHVIPADRKWYRNLAVGRLLLDALRGMNPQWPAADFDIDTEKQRLVDEVPPA